APLGRIRAAGSGATGRPRNARTNRRRPRNSANSPRRTIRSGAQTLENEAGGERVVGVEEVVGGAGDPGSAGDGGDDGGVVADRGFLDQAAGEAGADEGLVDEVGVEGEPAAGVQLSHPRGRTRAARPTVEPAGGDRHRV